MTADLISRQAERTNERTETHACDSISRQAAMIVIENSGLDDDSKDTVVRVLEQLPSAQPEQRWIPCSERLPEHGGFYIVTRVITEENDKWVGLRWYSTGHGWEWDETPIAWMPLPEPYKERQDE